MSDQQDTHPTPMAGPRKAIFHVKERSARRRQRVESFSASTALRCAIALGCIATAAGFVPCSTSVAISGTKFVCLEARKNDEETLVHQVKPRSVSVKDRERAVEAMAQQQAHEAAVVNGHVLEMLSDSFLYPSSRNTYSRPRGRPEMVPGAMTYETMLNYRERAKALKDGKISLSAYTSSEFTKAVDEPYIEPYRAAESVEPSQIPTKRGRGRPKKNDDNTVVKGSRKITATAESKPGPKLSAGPSKTRKRVVKNLPTPRSREEEIPEAKVDESVTFISSKRKKTTVAADLQKYYRTDLLTAKEEYSLGTQVQFMVKCESVHEGLALRLERLPSMVEWARACG